MRNIYYNFDIMKLSRNLLTLLLTVCLMIGICLPAVAADIKKATFGTPGGKVPAVVKTESIQVMFSPKEVPVMKPVPWKHHDIPGLDAPALYFTSGRPFKVSAEFVFDTSLEGMDVRMHTELVRMAIIEAGSGPISLTIDDVQLEAVVSDYMIVITEYNPEGIPIVATMTCIFDSLTPAKKP